MRAHRFAYFFISLLLLLAFCSTELSPDNICDYYVLLKINPAISESTISTSRNFYDLIICSICDISNHYWKKNMTTSPSLSCGSQIQIKEYLQVKTMMDEHRRKPFEQCSQRHQRRIIQEDIKEVFRNLQYVQSFDNNNLVCVDEVESVCNVNSDLQINNVEKDFAKSQSISIELMEDFISKNNSHYTSDDDSKVNKLFDADMQFSDEKSDNLKCDLHDWSLRNNVTHTAINELLQLLSKYIPDKSLPKDARTLLHTSHTSNYISIAGGEYVHFGLQNVITMLMDKYTVAGHTVNNVTLMLNIDGVPISKSSTRCLWPILVCDEIFKSVHMIGIYFGANKPTSANHFLEQFINEFKILVQDGFMYGDRIISVNLSTIICDAPAKSFILYTKGHTGFSSCSKCTIVGEYVNRTICFPYSKILPKLRTDRDFAQQTDEEYHRGETLLLQIPNVGLVSAIALDHMHLICLGVVKKVLLLLMKGPLSIRIGSRDINLISEHLIALRSSVPKEFSRKSRSLLEIKYWKATEFRQFLLYTGPVVLKSILTSQMYEHFLVLHVAISILVTPALIADNENIKYAEKLLIYFMESFQVLYGKQFISHNVHNLLHLCNEVRRNEVLDNFSAFRFESFLGSLKTLIRKPEKPLQQIARRYIERQFRMFKEQVIVPTNKLKYKHHNGPLMPEFSPKTIIQYKILKTSLFYYHCDDASNNMFMLDNNTIVKVLNILMKKRNNDIYIIGRKCNIINTMYETPCSSALLSIFVVAEDLQLSFWNIKKIIYKMWVIQKTKTEFIVMPLRHNIN